MEGGDGQLLAWKDQTPSSLYSSTNPLKELLSLVISILSRSPTLFKQKRPRPLRPGCRAEAGRESPLLASVTVTCYTQHWRRPARGLVTAPLIKGNLAPPTVRPRPTRSPMDLFVSPGLLILNYFLEMEPYSVWLWAGFFYWCDQELADLKADFCCTHTSSCVQPFASGEGYLGCLHLWLL